MYLKENACAGQELSITFIKSILLGATETKSDTNEIEIKLTGFEAKLLDVLSSTINFTYNLIETKNSDFGMLKPDGTWSGAVGLLSRNVWIALLFSSIFILIMLSLIWPKHKPDRYWTILYGIIMFQGGPMSLRDSASTLVRATWLVVMVFIVSYYSNSLTASTSVARPVNINTLDQLAEFLVKSDTKIYLRMKSSVVAFMSTIQNEHRKIRRQLGSYVDQYGPDELRATANGEIAIITGKKQLALYLGKYNLFLQFNSVEEPLYFYTTALGLRKNFTCKFALNQVIGALKETGTLAVWEEEMMRKHSLRAVHQRKEGPKAHLIGFSDLKSSFLLLIASYVLSFSALVYNYVKQRKFKQRTKMARRTKTIQMKIMYPVPKGQIYP